MNQKTVKHTILFFLLLPALLTAPASSAAINPVPGAELNFTQVLFEYDEVIGADYYFITIDHKGGSTTPIRVRDNSLAFILDSGLQFGNRYQWYYEAYKNNKPVFKSELFYFSIGSSFQTGSLWFKGVAKQTDPSKYKKGIIFLDYLSVAVNRKGEPVWFLPVNKDSLDKQKTRNLKLTAAGNITYLDNTDCFEKDIYGNTTWKAPNDGRISGDKQEYYHHDFFKMHDGTFITAGYRFSNERNLVDTSQPCRIRYNTLIQYNQNGEVVWHWDEAKHVSIKSIWGDNGPYANEISGTHLNGVAYYPPDDAFLVSFRDNSSVLKISHKTGSILYNLGDSLLKYNRGVIPFSGQHGPSILRNGGIVVYNNNLDRTEKKRGPSYPLIRVFSQPSATKQSKLVWEYECVSSRYPEGIRGKEGFASQLPYSDNLLVCMGGANYIFEVTPAKKVVWQCAFSRYDETSAQWIDVNNYRCSYAASLYPCYFSLQSGRFSKANTTLSVRINNEGTEDDSYAVNVTDENGIAISKEQNVAVKAGNYKEVNILVSDSGTNPVKILVRSATNPLLVKEKMVPRL